MRRRFVRRGFRSSGGAKPTRDWVSVVAGWNALTGLTVTTASPLITLQAPTTLALTSDPPEDLTVLRLIGDFQVGLANVSSASWTLALIRQDTPFTPSLTFVDDADKRMLWSQTYDANLAALSVTWSPPGTADNGTVFVGGLPREATHLDISPKVKLSAGQGLYLVAYENEQGASFTTVSWNMRMLYQRSRRR